MKKAVLYLSIALIVVPDIAIAQQGSRPPSGGGARPSPSTRPAPPPHAPAVLLNHRVRPVPRRPPRARAGPTTSPPVPVRPSRAGRAVHRTSPIARVVLRPSLRVRAAPPSNRHGPETRVSRIVPAPDARPISGPFTAPPTAIRAATVIGAGRSACSCRQSSSRPLIIMTITGAWAWARRLMAIAGSATAPTCCWSRSGRAAWSMSSTAPSTEAETERAASCDAALFSCPGHSPRRVKRKTVAGGKLRTVWPARTTSKPSWSSTARLTGGRVE